ncbi:receptor-transporting protein 3-like [Melanotaenia boesemani]|uniref:receptor-transporting protein 3-like n=1 Tax=Melanotaenia boesemani TaxID=1250792 RepID=UPI001C05776F|nr:receptor-transporting protein 3-like [Melanotaenia boesemani]
MSKHDWVPTLWLDLFEKLLNDDKGLDNGDKWTLNFNYSQTDKVTKEEKKREWRVCSYHAHGRFKCRSCNKTWPSARVGLLFRYRLRGHRGIVMMRPFGQACRDCDDNKFYLPGFEMENVEHALLKLFKKIREKCYGEKADKFKPKSTKVLTKPHETELCEACLMGFCCQADKF